VAAEGEFYITLLDTFFENFTIEFVCSGFAAERAFHGQQVILQQAIW
jgi:hypothetical protein